MTFLDTVSLLLNIHILIILLAIKLLIITGFTVTCNLIFQRINKGNINIGIVTYNHVNTQDGTQYCVSESTVQKRP
jgi:hypothetical protein